MLFSFPYVPFLSQEVSPEHDNSIMSMPMPMPMPAPTGSGSNDTMNMKHAAMHMSFFWGKDAIVLFQGWPDKNLGMYILALAFVFLLSLAVEVLSASPTFKAEKRPFVGGLIHASVYAVRVALGYLVMLSVMSFNIGVFIAAVAGHTVGYFLVKFRELAAASRSAATSDSAPKV